MGEIHFNIPINFNSTIAENKRKEKIIKLKSEEDIIKSYWEEKKTIPKCGYQFIEEYCSKHLSFIIDKAYDKDPRCQEIFFDHDFQIAMYYNHRELNDEYTVKFNSLFIDKMILMGNGNGYNEKLSDLLVDNAMIVNRVKTNIIMALGNEEFDACWYVANRYSSFKTRNGIIRLTRALQRANMVIMSEQMIVNIYSKLCADNMTDLFCAVMEDRYDEFYNESESIVYSNVSIAILEIMEKGVSSYDMEKVLMAYIHDINTKKIKGRFYLGSINSADYPRINTVLDILREKGIEFR